MSDEGANRYVKKNHDGSEATAWHNTIYLPFARRTNTFFEQVLIESGRISANDLKLHERVDRVISHYAKMHLYTLTAEGARLHQPTRELILAAGSPEIIADPQQITTSG